ncbi:HAMP domain-containing histidine kinase [Fusibacter paucivorans]|uniref:histidine kinase n=1 Tax=Fusibacter paucivorans TaxID=76009 RepID=A0ABS5PS01_9FIRM|nr:HAMP domain-containing sensor histidine kinase [Fusibacter paucivorans]MBS7526847.1 HAMP domain-containing histidine kinase [Fusibacter paucivorans]
MAKRKRAISLSFVLLRFAVVMIGSMMLCILLWLIAFSQLQRNGVIYQGYVSSQQVAQMLSGDPEIFIPPDDSFLAEYILFNRQDEIVASNIEGKAKIALERLYRSRSEDASVKVYTYRDGSTIIIRWHYRAEFTNSKVRTMLPPFEYLWLAALGAAWVLCLLINTLWLRHNLAEKLKLFTEVSQKVADETLDFEIPRAGIREYDNALDAMAHMRDALYHSLSLQWSAQQNREAEITALAHDLKTPLTLVGGNAELLLEEELPEKSRKKVTHILMSNERAKKYVANLLSTAVGTEEPFEEVSTSDLEALLLQQSMPIADAEKVSLNIEMHLSGSVFIQKEQLLRALINVIQNAIEHTGAGGCVLIEADQIDDCWYINVYDEGPGFSSAALKHATERLWRGDSARSIDGHNGLGLWYAAKVIAAHGGQLTLDNYPSGGVVKMVLKVSS